MTYKVKDFHGRAPGFHHEPGVHTSSDGLIHGVVLQNPISQDKQYAAELAEAELKTDDNNAHNPPARCTDRGWTSWKAAVLGLPCSGLF